MNRDDWELAIFTVLVFLYLCAIVSLFSFLGKMNTEVKKEIYQHYNVPLDGK